jgi:hypothetical protein
LVNRFDTATRAQARQAMKNLLASCEGPRLPTKWRGVSPRRAGFSLLGLCAGLAAFVLLGMGALAFRLAQGPIALESLAPRITQSLEERFGHQYSFALGPTSLERGENGVTLAFQGIAIKDRAGRTLIAAPKGEIWLDLLALAGLDVKAKRLELVGLDLHLTVQPDGSLSVEGAKAPGAIAIDLPAPPKKAPDAQAQDGGSPPALAAQVGPLVWNLVEAITGQNQALDRLGIAHGRLEVEDGVTHRKAVFEDVDLSFDKSGAVAGLKMSARGPAGRWSIAMDAQGVGLHSLSIEAHDLNLDDFLLASGRKVPFEATMPISAKIDIELAADKSLAAMSGRFGLGAGYFKLDDPDHQPFLVDEATGGWSWDASRQRFLIENFQLFAGQTQVFFGGALTPPSPTNPAWSLGLEASEAVLAGDRPDDQPTRLDKAVFQARYLAEEKRLILDNFAVSGPDANGSLKSEILFTSVGPTLKLKLDMAETSFVNVPRLWPSFIMADVRKWCIQNLRGGELASGSLAIDWDAPTFETARKKQPVPPDSVHGEFSARDASIQLLSGIPLLSGLDGGGVVTGHEFTLSGKHGFMDVSPGRRILANDISFVIPDTSPKPLNPAQAIAHLQGPADALADLISRDALKPFVGVPVDPASVKGQFDGNLTLDLKLGKTARPEDTVVHADAALSNFQVDKFLGAERFEQGALTVSSDAGALKISGDGKLFGVAANLQVDKGANDAGLAQVSFTLDDAARAKHGFAFGPGLTGPMAVRVKAPLSQKGADVDIDLSRMTIDSSLAGLVKPAGKPGKATFSVKADVEGGTSISNIVVDAGAASIKGSAQLSSDGSFLGAKLSQVRFSPGDDLKADISNADSGLKILVRGAALDSRPIVKGLLEQGPSTGPGKDFDLDFKVNSVAGANKLSLSQVEISLSRRDGELRQMKADAHIGSAPVTLRRDENGVMRVTSADAGGLVRFFNLYQHLEGGALDLAMRNVDGRQEGEAVVRRFVLRGEPALRQLVAAGQTPAAEGRTEGVKTVDPDAAPFQKMTAKFSRNNGRIDLREAVIYDNQMGLTTDGFIDYAHDRLDLNGTFVPAYPVNNIFNQIPVVGTLLGGGAHEGMFAVNYRIAGPASAPVLTVNPFSAMTPGFLRKVFGAIDGTTPMEPNAPAEIR